MNLKALLLVSSIPLAIGTRITQKETNYPEKRDLSPSSYVYENGHFLDDEKTYQLDIFNKSHNYIDASSFLLEYEYSETKKTSKPLLADRNLAIFPNQKISIYFNVPYYQPETFSPSLSCQNYVTISKTVEFEDTIWVSCEKASQNPEDSVYKYKFYKRPFNYTGKEHIVYTISADGEQYSFYGNSIQSESHTFYLNKKVDLSDLKLTNIKLLQTKLTASHEGVVGAIGKIGTALAGASMFLIGLIGLLVVLFILLVVLVIVGVVKSVRRKKKK